jgi:hypothetical protein
MHHIEIIAPKLNTRFENVVPTNQGFGVLLVVDGVHTHITFNTREAAEYFMVTKPETYVAVVADRAPDMPPTITRFRLYQGFDS